MIKGSIQEEDIMIVNICTLGSTPIYKANANSHKWGNQQQYNNTGGLKHPT